MKEYNYISYSLWGDKAIYNVGILKNLQQAKEIYPGWKTIVYYDETVPLSTIESIQKEGGDVVNMTGISYGMFWRFLAADLPDCNFVIFRDSDSRLSEREKMAVDEWIKSGRSVHIMRDHPAHKIPYGANGISILGGMWGIKGNVIRMKELIEQFSKGRILGYGVDQAFLQQIHTQFKNDSTVHDEFFSKAPFPLPREGYRFIGERIDENDQPFGDDWVAIKNLHTEKSVINRGYRLLGRIFNKLRQTPIIKSAKQ